MERGSMTPCFYYGGGHGARSPPTTPPPPENLSDSQERLSMMRAFTHFPLDDDITESILTSLEDFHALGAMLLSCKAVHAVWKRHPKSIMRAIARNAAGPAWPCALQAVSAEGIELRDVTPEPEPEPEPEVKAARTLSRAGSAASIGLAVAQQENADDNDNDDTDEDEDDDSDEEDDDDDENLALNPLEVAKYARRIELLQKEDSMLDYTPTIKDGLRLNQVAQTVRELEDIFSQRHKDISSQRSVLTDEESYKFRRAMYRFWTFRVLFGWQGSSQYERYNASETRMDHMKTYLEQFDTTELLELRECAFFLIWIINWTSSASTMSHYSANMIIAQSPEFVLQSFQRLHLVNVHVNSWSMGHQFILEALHRIKEAKGIKDVRWDATTVEKVIANPVNGGTDMCDHCNLVHGTQLYTESNWHFLTGDLPKLNLYNLLPGTLSRHYDMRRIINSYVEGPLWSHKSMMRDLFDRAEEDNTGGGWARDGQYCLPCVNEFVRDHLYLLLRRREGHNIPDAGCWYGWNCRTMVHNQEHARKLNHFCVPTRGDST